MPTPTPTPSATPTSTGGDSGKKLLIILLVVILGLGVLGAIGSWLAAKAVGFGLKKALEAGGVAIDERGGTVTLGGRDGERMQIGEDGTIVFTDEEGQTATVKSETGKLPADFTADFPIHGSMTASGGSVTQAPKVSLHAASWLSTASIPELDAWYRSQLPQKGWTMETAIGGTTEEGSIIVFTRGEGDDQEGGQLTIVVDDGRTAVHALVTIRN